MTGALVRVGWHDFIIPESVSDVEETRIDPGSRVGLWRVRLTVVWSQSPFVVTVWGNPCGPTMARTAGARWAKYRGSMSPARCLSALGGCVTQSPQHVDLHAYMDGPGWWLTALCEDVRERASDEMYRRDAARHAATDAAIRRAAATATVAVPRRPSHQMVYLMSAAGRLKIGISRDPESRRATMQTGCPDRIDLVATIPGGQSVEAELHARFADLRERGEWFTDCPEIRRAFSVS